MDDMSDSEDEYTENEKILLDGARKTLNKRRAESDEEEVFGLDSEDGDDVGLGFHGRAENDEDEDDIDMESDLEDREDGLPDDRAWGKKKKHFYSTDFVDQDYGGVLQGREAEAAELEEQEARNIQKRLVEQLNDADFAMAEMAPVAAPDTKEFIKADLSALSERQKLDLFAKESPEFANLVEDFKVKMTEVQEQLMPVVNAVEANQIQPSVVVDYVRTKLEIILNYCTNISFYLLLKSKRIPVKDHPVLKSLVRYRQILQQLSPVEEVVQPQIVKVLTVLKTADQVPSSEPISKKKKVLKILKEKKKRREIDEEKQEDRKKKKDPKSQVKMSDTSSSEEDAKEEKIEETGEVSAKRGITYEMAKNKGLIPKRSKEQRNPRVKHRNKFRKAVIRRRGQVRTARPEIPVYGGEPGGIKIGLTKSIKLK